MLKDSYLMVQELWEQESENSLSYQNGTEMEKYVN